MPYRISDGKHREEKPQMRPVTGERATVLRGTYSLQIERRYI
jgi:hypothetical protein